MYVEKMKVMDFSAGADLPTYRVSINGFHVTVVAESGILKGKIVFSREVIESTSWLDPQHTKITKAITALEKAILEAVAR